MVVVDGAEAGADVGVRRSHSERISERGVVGRLADFGGPSRGSSLLRLARSTVSRNVIAASRFVKQ